MLICDCFILHFVHQTDRFHRVDFASGSDRNNVDVYAQSVSHFCRAPGDVQNDG